MLFQAVGWHTYNAHHGSFIHENRADLFSILDVSSQIDKHFKTSFSKEMLQSFVRYNASIIVKFYTKGQVENDICMLSPMEKFDDFFKQYLPNYDGEIQFKKINSITNHTEEEILHSLLLGDSIPKPILVGLAKLSTKDSPSIDFSFELQNIICKYVNSISEVEMQNDGMHR